MLGLRLELAFGGEALGFGEGGWDGALEVVYDGLLERGLVQGGGRMIHGDDEASVDELGLAVDLADLGGREEAHHRVAAKGDDNLGIDGGDLLGEIV